MLGISFINGTINESNFIITDVIRIRFTNGKSLKYVYTSDNLIGYDFSSIRTIFRKINDFIELINLHNSISPIVSIINNQALLVNKHMYSIVSVKLQNNSEYDYNISSMFDILFSDIDLYILANDCILNIITHISEVLNNERKNNLVK